MVLEKCEQELEHSLADVGRRDLVLRSEVEEVSRKLREVRTQLEMVDVDAEHNIGAEIRALAGHRDANAKQKHECEELQNELDELLADEATATNDADECSARLGEVGQTLMRAHAMLAETVAERERQNQLASEWSHEIEHIQEDIERSRRSARSVQQLTGGIDPGEAVQELEEMLRYADERLENAQDVVHYRRVDEEELRAEFERVRELMHVHAADGQATCQANLQMDTVARLEDHQRKIEGEVGVLTIALHDADRRTRQLQEDSAMMLQHVESREDGSWQDWVVELQRMQMPVEIVRCKDEIDMWKCRTDQFRMDRRLKATSLQRRHEETLESLLERNFSLQSEIGAVEQMIERWEAAGTRSSEDDGGDDETDAPSGIPGLVIPQRPLPEGHHRRRALLVGTNYVSSHAPLKGCINDVWSLQCLLRYTLQYDSEQVRSLLDSADGIPTAPERVPTRENIIEGLEWLCDGAKSGDSLLFAFCGYGTQQPRTPDSDQYEAYLVPTDFAADLPSGLLMSSLESPPPEVNAWALHDSRAKGYRLISLLEINNCLCRLPAGCRATVLFDCCYPVIPSVSPMQNWSSTFSRVDRGQVDYIKLRNFLSRPRFLELPPMPVRHTARHLRANVFPACFVHSFSACKLREWSAEFPIEGTVQGAFSWAFLKALSACHFHCGVYQFQQVLTKVLLDLKTHFMGVEQTPLLQLSQSAAMQDVVLAT
eukprot:NODE_1899_length_2341_cov_7.087624.p1 GENE.NODE_1899_length_2341_cov_7.087624~~NODE_1899_length_2341_cov_7.087624.p1  ORF type:complete len:729 (+),score=192.80 NODE_1899_length_2341_cov_7.087624:44-2188(+)